MRGFEFDRIFRRDASFLALFFALTIGSVYAQSSPGPQPTTPPAAIATPVDTPFPGTISLLVDATDVHRRVLKVHETIPVKGRDITLLYPEWLPGTHSPSNPISALAGLVITANGRRVPWSRDRVNMYAFHVEAPKDATSLDIDFEFLAPLDPKRGRISATFADVTWNSVLLYPAGYFSRDIKFGTSLRLPDGWKFACALDVKGQD